MTGFAYTDKTWDDLLSYISKRHNPEGGAPDDDIYLELANDALAEISEMGILQTHWDDADLTLTGNSLAMPPGIITVTRFELDGQEIRHISLAELDRRESDWRTFTGVPGWRTYENNCILFDGIPTGTKTLYGTCYLPEIVVDDDGVQTDPNPLEYLPFGRQLLPGDFVLKELPADPENPIECERVRRAARKWEEGKAALGAVIASRMRRRVSNQ